MNILLVISTPGDREGNKLALIPRIKMGLTNSQLDAIDGQEVQDDDLLEETRDSIVQIFMRLGIEPSKMTEDLKEYLDPKPPYTVDRVVRISWAV